MKQKISFMVILFMILFLPGCWDIQDVNNTAFVLGIGIDKSADSKTSKYEVTFEIAKPTPLNENPTAKSIISRVEAYSILDAIRRVETSISRSVSLTHLRLIVVGEGLSREESFRNIANYFMKEPTTALQYRLLFVENARAQEIFHTQLKLEPRVAGEIVSMGLQQQELGMVRTNNFVNFFTDLQRSDGTALGSRVIISGDENIIIREGAAVYKDWKLDTWLNADEAQAANWLLEGTKPVVVASDENSTYVYDVRKQKTSIKPLYKKGNPSFIVEIMTEGMVMEELGEDLDLSKSENLKNMETLFSQTIRQQTLSAIDKSQKEIGTDYLGFGKAFEQYYPQVYQSLQWEDAFPTVPIEIRVKSKVKGYGQMK